MTNKILYQIGSGLFLLSAVLLVLGILPNAPEGSASISIVLYWQMVILIKLEEMNE